MRACVRRDASRALRPGRVGRVGHVCRPTARRVVRGGQPAQACAVMSGTVPIS